MPRSNMPAGSTLRAVLGVGLSSVADTADAIALAEAAIVRSGLQAGQIDTIATIETRRGNAVLAALAGHFNCGVVYFGAVMLEAETPRLKNPSQALFARIGCHGVAEAAALAAAGEQAVLVVEKMTGRGATVAIAVRSAVF